MSVGGRPEGAGPCDRLVVIVASLGGLGATSTVLQGLPQGFSVPVVVLQHGVHHIPPSNAHSTLLQRRSPLPVSAAPLGLSELHRGVTVVPPGWGAVVHPDGLFVDGDAKGGGGDELLISAAGVVGPGVVAVILTGRLADGSEGARAVKRRGGRVLAQDPRTAKAPSMPTSTIATGCVDFGLPTDKLGPVLTALMLAPGGSELLRVRVPSWARL